MQISSKLEKLLNNNGHILEFQLTVKFLIIVTQFLKVVKNAIWVNCHLNYGFEY